jgi:hypothetical protein
VAIRWEIADAIQRRRRTMRHDALFGGSLPARCLRRELQPGGTEVEVVRRGNAG